MQKLFLNSLDLVSGLHIRIVVISFRFVAR